MESESRKIPERADLSDVQSREELAKAFSVSPRVVDRFVEMGLPYYPFGRTRWFFIDEVREFLRTKVRRLKEPQNRAVRRTSRVGR